MRAGRNGFADGPTGEKREKQAEPWLHHDVIEEPYPFGERFLV